MTRIDSRTAKKLVPGVLKVELEKQIENDCLNVAAKQVEKFSKVQTAVKNEAHRMFADCLIYDSWHGRTYIAVGVVPIAPVENSRPYHGVLRYLKVSTRAKSHTGGNVAVVTTHVMERLLERKHSANLIGLMREEFDWNFIKAVVHKYSELKDTTYTECQCKMQTKNGFACMLFKPNETPVITTWHT